MAVSTGLWDSLLDTIMVGQNPALVWRVSIDGWNTMFDDVWGIFFYIKMSISRSSLAIGVLHLCTVIKNGFGALTALK